MILLFLQKYWMQAALGIIIISLFAHGKVQTGRLENAKDTIDVLETVIERYHVLTEQQKVATIELEKKSKHETKLVADSYDYQLKQVKEYYEKHPNVKLIVSKQLLPESTNSGASPTETVPNTTSAVDGSSSYVPTVEECTITTLMLVKLQDWARAQEKLGCTP